jgi:hypothetical protein
MMPPDGFETPAGDFEGYFVKTALDDSYFQKQQDFAIVHVKGSGWFRKTAVPWLLRNPAGHTLLWLGPNVGFVHSCEPGYHKARYIPSEKWGEYCTAMGKPENPTQVVTVGDRILSMRRFKDAVNDVLLNGYNWNAIHNCSTMADELFDAGGVMKKCLSECPVPQFSVAWNDIKSLITTGATTVSAFPGNHP